MLIFHWREKQKDQCTISPEGQKNQYLLFAGYFFSLFSFFEQLSLPTTYNVPTQEKSCYIICYIFSFCLQIMLCSIFKTCDHFIYLCVWLTLSLSTVIKFQKMRKNSRGKKISMIFVHPHFVLCIFSINFPLNSFPLLQ